MKYVCLVSIAGRGLTSFVSLIFQEWSVRYGDAPVIPASCIGKHNRAQNNPLQQACMRPKLKAAPVYIYCDYQSLVL